MFSRLDSINTKLDQSFENKDDLNIRITELEKKFQSLINSIEKQQNLIDKQNKEFPIATLTSIEKLYNLLESHQGFLENHQKSLERQQKKLNTSTSVVIKEDENISRNGILRSDSLTSSDVVGFLSEDESLQLSTRFIASSEVSSVIDHRNIYPDSSMHRVSVPEDKRSWEIKWNNYAPLKYTAKNILFNEKSDIDLISL